jgi:hypothetical protein
MFTAFIYRNSWQQNLGLTQAALSNWLIACSKKPIPGDTDKSAKLLVVVAVATKSEDQPLAMLSRWGQTSAKLNAEGAWLVRPGSIEANFAPIAEHFNALYTGNSLKILTNKFIYPHVALHAEVASENTLQQMIAGDELTPTSFLSPEAIALLELHELMNQITIPTH